MTMLAQKPKQLFRSPFEHPLLAPGQFHGRIPHRNGHRLLLALCAQAGADHTPGPEVDPQTVTDRNDPAFEPIGALAEDSLPAPGETFLICAVGAAGAREEIRAVLEPKG